MVFTLIQIAKKMNLLYQPFFGVKFGKRFVTNSIIYFLKSQKIETFLFKSRKTTIFIYVAQVGSQKYVRMLIAKFG
jgi:hypothetical protein